MAYTVRDQIEDALQEIGIVGPDQPADDVDILKGLRTLRRLYGRFQGDRLFLRTVTRTPGLALTPLQQAYTVGDGGDLDIARPQWLTYVAVSPVGDTTEIPVIPYYDRDEWLAEMIKDLQDAYPRRCWYEPTTPFGTLTVWPIPTTAATLAISRPTPLTELDDDDNTALQTELVFAPCEEEAWLYQLAKRLCRPFTRPLTDDVREDAREALAAFHRLNDGGPPAQITDLVTGNRGGFDIKINRYVP